MFNSITNMMRPPLGDGARYISTDEAQKMLTRKQINLALDVRSPEERQQGFIDGTILIPLDALPHSVERIIEHKKGPILIHCHTHQRSAKAANFLLGEGFSDIRVMEGGIKGWSEKEKPLSRTQSAE